MTMSPATDLLPRRRKSMHNYPEDRDFAPFNPERREPAIGALGLRTAITITQESRIRFRTGERRSSTRRSAVNFDVNEIQRYNPAILTVPSQQTSIRSEIICGWFSGLIIIYCTSRHNYPSGARSNQLGDSWISSIWKEHYTTNALKFKGRRRIFSTLSL